MKTIRDVSQTAAKVGKQESYKKLQKGMTE